MKAMPTMPRPTTTIFFLEPTAMVLEGLWYISTRSRAVGSLCEVSSECQHAVCCCNTFYHLIQAIGWSCEHVTTAKDGLRGWRRNGIGYSRGETRDAVDGRHELAMVCLLYQSGNQQKQHLRNQQGLARPDCSSTTARPWDDFLGCAISATHGNASANFLRGWTEAAFPRDGISGRIELPTSPVITQRHRADGGVIRRLPPIAC